MKALIPLFFVFAAAPLAAQPPETVTRAVSSAGLDLTTDAGLRALRSPGSDDPASRRSDAIGTREMGFTRGPTGKD